MNEALIEKGLNITDQIVNGLKDAAPQMVDLTLAAVKLKAFVDLLATVVWCTIAIVAWIVAVKLGRYLCKKVSDVIDPFGYIMTAILLLPTITFTPSIIFLCNFFNTYMWAGLVDPRVALAMRALDKVLAVTGTK